MRKTIFLILTYFICSKVIAQQDILYTMDEKLSNQQLTLTNFRKLDLQSLFAAPDFDIMRKSKLLTPEYFILTEQLFLSLNQIVATTKWNSNNSITINFFTEDHQIITTRVANVEIQDLSGTSINKADSTFLGAYYYIHGNQIPPKFPEGATCLQVKSFFNSNDSFIFNKNSLSIPKIKKLSHG